MIFCSLNYTNIFFINNNTKEVESTMNEELKLVLKYCAINKLSVNLKKKNNKKHKNKNKKLYVKNIIKEKIILEYSKY